ncbi:oligosaccharide flippase family protein [Patescibacteria group bacterium]|nr:oligosaccharide flippase family protein [Patescibacteria group bacterium]
MISSKEKTENKVYDFLRWTEKWTKTDMIYLFKGVSWLTLGNITSSLASFLLAVAFANLIPKETYGTYKYILSLMGLLTIPGLTRMAVSVTRAVARGYEGTVTLAIKTKIRWGLLSGLTSLIFSGYYYYSGDTVLSIAFLITSIFLPFTGAFAMYEAVLNGKKLFKETAIYNTSKQIVSVTIMIFILFFSGNIFLMIFSYFATETLLNLIFLKITLKKIPLNKKIDPETISYGKHLSLMNILNSIAEIIDKTLLWHFLGATPLAIYSFALAPVFQMKALIVPVSNIAFPKLANVKHNIKKNLLVKITKFSFVLIIPLGMYLMLSSYLFSHLFPQYIEALKYSQLFSFMILFIPFDILNSYLTAQSQKKSLYILSTANPIVKITLLFLLVPTYGILGAIITLLLVRLFNTLILLYLFLKNNINIATEKNKKILGN